jgi:signal transduction histidine kinase
MNQPRSAPRWTGVEGQRAGGLLKLPRWLIRSVVDAFAGPFRSGGAKVADLPVDQLDRQRRRLILRLILTFVLLTLLLVALPIALARSEPSMVVALFLGLILFAALGLWVNHAGHTTAAASAFILAIFAGTVALAASRSGDSTGVLVSYANLSVFLLIAGLTLPAPLLWASALTANVLTVGGLLFFPFAPHPPVVGIAPDYRGLATEIVTFQLLIALLAQVYVSSSRASLRASAQAYQQERALAALKDQFLIDANHELRTPVMALSSNVQLLAKLGERATSEDRARLLDRASQAATRLQRLLHNVLDAGALEAGAPRVEPQPVTLSALVHETLETFDPVEVGEPGLTEKAAQARSVTVSVPADLMVHADPARLRQILVNLVANAIKYSEPGTPLAIRASLLGASLLGASTPVGQARHSAPAERLAVQVSVQDQGLGVPPAQAHQLFQRFVRLQRDIAGSVRGTGVGLYVTRTLVEAMGGRIWVESAGVPGEGSTFHFTLPAVVDPGPSATPDGSPDSSSDSSPDANAMSAVSEARLPS